MEMFSEELYILDRNTEKFMFEEMQRELDEMREAAKEMNEKYTQSIRSAVEIMRSLNLGDQEIIGKLCGQYHFDEKQAKEFL